MEGARDGLLFLTLCLPASILPRQGSCFNLGLTNHTEYSGPKGSHFGFSVDFYQAGSKNVNVVVGAPRDGVGPSQGGSVFLCPWTPSRRPCHKLGFDQTGDQNITFNNMLLTTHKTNQWLGGTIRVHKNSILACAPLFHWNVIEEEEEAMNTPVGNCQLLNMLTGEVANYAPCRGIRVEASYVRARGFQDRRYCEAGFSSDITKDGKVVLGAPGGFFFQGQIITAPLQSIMTSGRTFSPMHYVTGETKSDERFNQYDLYLGYSVATGQFNADHVTDYVVGIPNDLNTAGSVKIFNGATVYPKIIISLRGSQIASYFGHCVAVTDINSDGRDDILVGSPLFMEHLSTKKLREVGQVYVYLQREDHKFSPRPEQTLTGTHAYGRFGIAVAPLGDIDHDGFRDVAVGAPGTGGGGLVFIFMGQSGGLNPQYTQVIESPFKSPEPVHAFGFSMRGGMDIDSNGYPDLIVGAWGADKVAIYRTKAVVRTKAQISFFPDFLNPDDRLCQLHSGLLVSCFNIMMCITVSGYRIPEEIVLNIDLQLDKLKSVMARRTLLLESAQSHKQFQVSIKRDTGILCKNFTAYLLVEFKDKLNPIFISLNYSLANSHDALLHGQSLVVAQTQIILDCGTDNICIPDLKLAAKAGTQPLLIGDDNPALVLVTAENQGEGAYEAELHVSLPAHMYYQTVQSDMEGFSLLKCVPKKENGSVIVVCDLGNPMKAGQKIQAGLFFSMSGLEDVETHVSFHLQIKSKNTQNSDSNPVEVQILVQAVVSLEIRGVSVHGDCVLPIANWEPKPHPEHLDDVGPLIEHVYELKNKGPSPVNARLQLHFPIQQNGSRLLYVFANASEELLSCHTDYSKIDVYRLVKPEPTNSSVTPTHYINKRDIQRQEEHPEKQHAETVHVNCSNTEVCMILTCEAAGLQRNGRAIVKVAARLWAHTFLQRPYVNYVLLSTAYYEVVDVPSKIQPKVLPSGQAEANTSVVWRCPDGQAEVPVWWIALSFFAGLLLLAMLSIVFWKMGFFKRHRPPTDNDDDDVTLELNAGLSE
ncbi:integrin alpha-IIb [Electrophorus electricus]|uniref:integrin alpha-IIb n=1 Tax=Electrophorus electricus TaxID=8005 RepID=UPI0015D03D39|nr:integrin alpha-IIb [Electrophorus electricus]